MTEEKQPPKERLTEEEVKRLCEEAKARGEPVTPILKRYVIQSIDDVILGLEAERKIN